MKRKTDLHSLAIAYYNAKTHVISNGYAPEIDWQDDLCFNEVTEQDFLKEIAWVVLASGMSDKVIRSVFPKMTNAFYNWESAEFIIENKRKIKRNALKVFNYEKKIDAILNISNTVYQSGFGTVKTLIEKEGVDFIITFPFMGPATSYHLAKNIGLQVAKPDRHLVRIANTTGYNCVNKMCTDIASLTEDKISVIDLVLWRYAAITKNYLSLFKA